MAGGGNHCKINLKIFNKRLKKFYDHRAENNNKFWGSSDAIVVVMPPISDDIRYFKSHALNNWLFERVFAEAMIVFINREIHFLCDQESASMLNALVGDMKIAVEAESVLHVKAKHNDGFTDIDEIIRAIRKSSSREAPIVGYIEEETAEGVVSETWIKKLKDSGFRLINVADGFSDLFVVKDETEQNYVKKAAMLSSLVMKDSVIPMLQKLVRGKNLVPHSWLMLTTENALLELEGMSPAEVNYFDVCYPPIFQSGGKFDFRPTATSNDDNLFCGPQGVIICAFGSRYKAYCSNVIRTFLIDGNGMQRMLYNVLLEAQKAAIAELKVGNKVCAVYTKAMEVVKRSQYVSKLTDSAGMGIGLLLHESCVPLNGSNERILEEGMVFNVSLGFQNLQLNCGGRKTKDYSLMLGDTVIVGKDGPQVLTDCPKDEETCFLKEKKLPRETLGTGTSGSGKKSCVRRGG